MRSRAELKAIAKKSLQGNYGAAIGAFFITIGLSIVPFCSPAISLGHTMFCNKLVRGIPASATDTFDGFSLFGKSLWLSIVQSFFIWAWSLLLVIPGLVATFSYAMAPYILADESHLSATDAISKSKAIMKGHRMDLFILELSFLGWGLLSVLTFGVLHIWLAPYMTATYAAFYNDLMGYDMIDPQ